MDVGCKKGESDDAVGLSGCGEGGASLFRFTYCSKCHGFCRVAYGVSFCSWGTFLYKIFYIWSFFPIPFGLKKFVNVKLQFTSALNYFLKEMYDFANPEETSSPEPKSTPKWLEVQKLAFSNDPSDEEKLKELVIEAERKSIKLPLVLIAKDTKKYGENLTIEKNHTVICDIVSIFFPFPK